METQPASVAGSVVESFKSEGARGEAGGGEDEEGERDGREVPGKNGAERCAQHPGERRIEDEARLACAVVGAGRPVRIRNAVTPGVEAVEPGDEVDVEVVAAGVAANELRDDGDEGGEENERGAGEATRRFRAPGPCPCSLVPCFSWQQAQRVRGLRGDGCRSEGQREGGSVVPVVPLVAEVRAEGIAAFAEHDVFG